MRKISYLLMLGMLALPAFAATESYKDVPVVDTNCSAKVAADPDAHTRACALKCEASGFGIITSDKKYIKFDAEGNKEIKEQLKEQLKASSKKDHLRVDVTGDLQGDTLKVTSVKLL